MVLRPDRFKGRICSPDEKLKLLTATGVDVVDVLTFDRAFSLQTPEEFLARVEAAFDVREIMVGEAFALGKDRAGNVDRLKEIGREMGFEVHAVQRLTNGDDIISSSAVRDAVIAGDVARAARLLGRRFHVDGVVIHGAHFGRKIGYPTANIEPPIDQVPLADGIYASYCLLPDEAHQNDHAGNYDQGADKDWYEGFVVEDHHKDGCCHEHRNVIPAQKFSKGHDRHHSAAHHEAGNGSHHQESGILRSKQPPNFSAKGGIKGTHSGDHDQYQPGRGSERQLRNGIQP